MMRVVASRKALGATAALVAVIFPSALLAQSGTKWETVAKATTANCPEGSIASIEERPGTLHMKIRFPDGKLYAEFDMAVAADGSGRTQFKTQPRGVVVDLELLAGIGKRQMKTSNTTNNCAYLWTPK